MTLERGGVHPDRPGAQGLVDDGGDHRADPGSARFAEAGDDRGRELVTSEHTGSQGIERVVRKVGDPIGESDAERLGGRGRWIDLPGVRPDPVADLPGQVRVLELLEDADALRGVVPLGGCEVRAERILAGMPERRVANVMAERDGLRQGLVQAQRGGEGSRNLRDLRGVGQARDVMVALGIEEDLCLVLQSAERLRVDDPIPISLECRPKLVGLLGARAAAGPCRSAGRWAEGRLVRLAQQPITASQVGGTADLLHGPMMPERAGASDAIRRSRVRRVAGIARRIRG